MRKDANFTGRAGGTRRVLSGAALVLSLVVVLAASPIGSGPTSAEAAAPNSASGAQEALSVSNPFEGLFERDDYGHYTVHDEDGNLLLMTGLVVSVGDEFISQDNHIYQIVNVNHGENTAKANLIGEADMSWEDEPTEGSPAAAWLRWLMGDFTAALVQSEQKTIGLYNTHSDESYEQTSGVSNEKGKGDVYAVAAGFEDSLQKLGFDVVHDEALHHPHNNQSYDRSRPTAQKLLRESNAATIFDIHRDTTPKEAYEAVVEGKTINQVMIVVGRQNPNFQANLAFAKRLKSLVDKVHPGVIRGIFKGKGDYNQDLSPRALLFEVGAHTNSLEQAQAGITLLADAIPDLLGVEAGQQPGAGFETAGGLRALGWILAITLIGGALYLIVSAGGVEQAKVKLREFVSSEFTNFLGDRALKRTRTNRNRRRRNWPAREDDDRKPKGETPVKKDADDDRSD